MSDDVQARPHVAARPARLRRNIGIWGAIGISLGLMAPSMAANINPQGTAATVGRAVPVAFALATAGVLLVAYTFARLTQRFHHAGSVYGFVGAALGSRAGVVAGWALVGTYTFYGVVTAMAGGRFAAGLLAATGAWAHPPAWSGFLLGSAGMAGVWWLAARPARGSTRVLLGAEAVTVILILIVVVVVFGKLATHTAPHRLGVDWSVFTLPSGTPASAVFLGVVFGFLSFAGFEAASTMGEETKRPTRHIPLAILGVAAFGGVYFVLVTAVEVMGFGTSAKGVAAFTASPSLLGDLGTTYAASWLGNLITAGAMISAFGSALACLVGASRITYALGRDHVLPAVLGHLSPRGNTPAPAAATVAVAIYAIIAFTWFVLRGDPFTLFLQTATTGTLILLVVYLLATVAMTRLVFFTGQATVPRWQLAIPALALFVLSYTLYRNVWPLPSGVAWWGPSMAAAWLATGITGVLARPHATPRAGRDLARTEGPATSTPAAHGSRPSHGDAASIAKETQ